MIRSRKLLYFLWFIGGLVGFHHLYLGRIRHSFIWFWTLGGFGVGWLRDLFRIPSYLSELRDDDPTPVIEGGDTVHDRATQQSSWFRVLGEVVVAIYFAVAFIGAFPYSFMLSYSSLSLCSPVPIAFGVYTVGCIGLQHVSFTWALIGACVTLPYQLLQLPAMPQESLTYSAILSAILANLKGKRRKYPRERQTNWMTYTKLTLAHFLMAAGVFLLLMHNFSVTTQSGETIMFKDAVAKVMELDLWNHKMESIHQFFFHLKHGNVTEFVRLTMNTEANDYKVLNLTYPANEKEIIAAYKKLIKIYHPDKVTNSDHEADKNFMKIQKAYERLSEKGRKRQQHREDL